MRADTLALSIFLSARLLNGCGWIFVKFSEQLVLILDNS